MASKNAINSFDKPIITPKEARKILGNEAKNLTDKQLYSVIIEIEQIINLICENIKVVEGGEK